MEKLRAALADLVAKVETAGVLDTVENLRTYRAVFALGLPFTSITVETVDLEIEAAIALETAKAILATE